MHRSANRNKGFRPRSRERMGDLHEDYFQTRAGNLCPDRRVLIGVVFLIGSFAVNGETWALKRFNQHLFTGGSLTSAGTIYDTKGVILAQTKDGERIYNDSRRIRKATLHMVGDTAGYISTGIHTIFRSELTGYNLVDGVYRLMEDGEGNNIRLTINAELCATALDALGDRKGTVGVYNYKTGEILCMVSSPTYDPERKPTDIDTDKTGKIRRHLPQPLLIRRIHAGLHV